MARVIQGRAKKKKKGFLDYVTQAASFIPVVGQGVSAIRGLTGGDEEPEDMGTVVNGTSQPRYITDKERQRYSYY